MIKHEQITVFIPDLAVPEVIRLKLRDIFTL